MGYCLYCKNQGTKNRHVSFHKFPTDLTLEKWIQNMGRSKDWIPKKGQTICSDHFMSECFIKHENRTTLKIGSSPTLFNQTKGREDDKNHIIKNPSVVPLTSFINKNSPEVGEELITTESHFIDTVIPNTRTDAEDPSVIPMTSFINKNSPEVRQEPITTESHFIDTVIPNTSTNAADSSTTSCDTPKKRKRLLFADMFRHDHNYEKSLNTLLKELNHAKQLLVSSRSTVKNLKHQVKRYKTRINSLKVVVKDLKRKQLVSQRHSQSRPSNQEL